LLDTLGVLRRVLEVVDTCAHAERIHQAVVGRPRVPLRADAKADDR
jgi:hypothetical protein